MMCFLFRIADLAKTLNQVLRIGLNLEIMLKVMCLQVNVSELAERLNWVVDIGFMLDTLKKVCRSIPSCANACACVRA